MGDTASMFVVAEIWDGRRARASGAGAVTSKGLPR